MLAVGSLALTMSSRAEASASRPCERHVQAEVHEADAVCHAVRLRTRDRQAQRRLADAAGAMNGDEPMLRR